MADQFEDFFYSSSDGLKLHARVYGRPSISTLPAICLPGLTRNAADFQDLALHLSNHAQTPRQVIVFDYRGRGRSAYDPKWQNYDPLVETGDVIAGLTALNVPHGAFIGTSRGGLIVHVLAAMRPALIRAVILNDIGPVVGGAGLMQIKAYLERAPRPKTFAEAVDIQRAIGGDASSALTQADYERIVRALYRDENGVPVPDFDPALINTVKAVDLTKPLPDFWPQFAGLADVPLMAIRGANSALLTAETLVEMGRRHPGMVAITVEGQGHAPLLETGDLPARIADFLAKADDTR